MNPEDIQQQFDDVQTQFDDLSQSQQDYADSMDSSLTDIQSTLDDQSSTISDLSNVSGQLQFPLTQDTIDLITEVINNNTTKQISGLVSTDNSGNATITNPLISASSVIIITPTVITSPASPHEYGASCAAGSASIFSNGVEYASSTFNYIIIF
jgi:hypothetical protein